MHILIVTHSFAPHNSPRALRWAAIARHWAARGHAVHVLCGHAAAAPATEEMDGVTVHRTAPTLSERVWGARDSPAVVANQHLGGPVRPATRLGHAPLRGIRALWRAVHWPDGECLWYRPATRLGAAVAALEPPDVIISVSLPFVSHLVARRLHARRPTLRWLVDTGDPFADVDESPSNNQRLYGPLNRWAERQIFSRCSTVTVTNEETRRRYSLLHPSCGTPIVVVPPVLVSPIPARAADHRGPGDPIKLVYVGSLYGELRSPRFLLSILDGLLTSPIGSRLEFHVYGKLFDCRELFTPFERTAEPRVFIHGTVPHDRARAALGDADVLVNVGNRTVYQLPSKLVEYASTGKPILNLAVRSNDSSHAFLADYPAVLSLIEGEESHGQQVERAEGFLERPPSVDPRALDRWLVPYSVGSVADAYERLLTDADPATATGGGFQRVSSSS